MRQYVLNRTECILVSAHFRVTTFDRSHWMKQTSVWRDFVLLLQDRLLRLGESVGFDLAASRTS